LNNIANDPVIEMSVEDRKLIVEKVQKQLIDAGYAEYLVDYAPDGIRLTHSGYRFANSKLRPTMVKWKAKVRMRTENEISKPILKKARAHNKLHRMHAARIPVGSLECSACNKVRVEAAFPISNDFQCNFCKRWDRTRNHPEKYLDLSRKDAMKMMKGICHYCHDAPPAGGNGIDRVDSNGYYTRGNCVSCCDVCNYMKSDLTSTAFFDKISKIYLVHLANDESANSNPTTDSSSSSVRFELTQESSDATSEDSEHDKPGKK
jgi:hypothetical protein